MESTTADFVRPRVGVVRESVEGERRVALVPKVVALLAGKGVDVVVESGAGSGALIPDAAYVEAGAEIGDPWSADVVVKVAPPTDDEVARLSAGQILIGFLAPRNADTKVGALKAAGVQAFAVEAIPRISRAQVDGCPLLAGQRRRLQGGAAGRVESTRFFPMLTTAAGTVKPATVLVLGVGVAGLQALATAKRLGGAHHRLRRTARGGRSGPLRGRAVAGPGHRRRRRGRLRA